MTQIFICIAGSQVIQNEIYENLQSFKWENLFYTDRESEWAFMQDKFRLSERVGGTASHLESELRDYLPEIKEKGKSDLSHNLAKNISLLFAIAIIP